MFLRKAKFGTGTGATATPLDSSLHFEHPVGVRSNCGLLFGYLGSASAPHRLACSGEQPADTRHWAWEIERLKTRR
jgi:hypothetical protein